IELAGFISSEVNRVNDLVARFLDFARPLQLQVATVALAPLLERAISDAQERWPDAPVRVERAYPPHPMNLAADATLLERAFSTLVANAFEAMLPQGGVLRIQTGADTAHLHIRFADSGSGVPGELREQIFNPFFTTKPTGTGLGLPIVAKIVDQHGGSLRLAECAGAGACFEIILPCS
ncbi:MAG: sensor histidine kinase, partial [Terriglobales bacterium]